MVLHLGRRQGRGTDAPAAPDAPAADTRAPAARAASADTSATDTRVAGPVAPPAPPPPPVSAPPVTERADRKDVRRTSSRRWRRHRRNPVSMLIGALGLVAALILVLGIALTWAGANPGNTLVDAVLDAGRRLATPFHDMFTRSDPDQQLYINWGIAAAVYYALGRVLAWITRF
ncbi:hypothetical protein [Actinomadura parmotrematis]|uniref:Uncharacterized protein n=1 Tax=Actinomadura parmotrematis TaxID=2864039 RepID=A0ABS7G5C5_9ACTN|nr:hypothetical protein [Actinomadura parmotrematis]MBW8487570.1 hypothetical protein [Actinomadura parmotrematis]